MRNHKISILFFLNKKTLNKIFFRSHECRSKLLSLEMILFIVQNFNMPLSDKHSFVFAIRHYLCVALTQNAVSPLNSVFEKALAIFVQLVNKLKVHLKRQIEVHF